MTPIKLLLQIFREKVKVIEVGKRNECGANEWRSLVWPQISVHINEIMTLIDWNTAMPLLVRLNSSEPWSSAKRLNEW